MMRALTNLVRASINGECSNTLRVLAFFASARIHLLELHSLRVQALQRVCQKFAYTLAAQCKYLPDNLNDSDS